MAKKTIKFGSMVRVLEINKSGIVIDKNGEKWLVAFANGDKLPYHSGELEVNTLID
jgi:hypothetical protein